MSAPSHIPRQPALTKHPMTSSPSPTTTFSATLTTKRNPSLTSTNRNNTVIKTRSLSINHSVRVPMTVSATSAVSPVVESDVGVPTIVDVDLGDRKYPIYIGSGLLNQPDLFTKAHSWKESSCVESVILPDGEKYKDMDTLMKVFDKAIESRLDRRCMFVALGGGVIGDMCGYAAASFLRGVNFIQIPTTVMAQVDSSVGGKTGINHRLGKNLIGAFYQPQCVLIDTDTLNTLPDRELASGLAEVVKYGLIRDAPFFEARKEHARAIV
nr:3-dehydroquinate synthase, chloroplastic [Tanacetum cinerariifolium]